MEQMTSFETAVAPHLDDLFRAAVCLMGNASDAEQAVARATRRALRKLDAADPAMGVRAWLFRNVLDEVRDRRQTALRFRICSFRARSANVAARGNHAASAGADTLSALRALPSQVAEVVLLVDVFEFSVGHAQETLGITSHAIAAHLREGRRLLSQALDRQAVLTGSGPGGSFNNEFCQAGALRQ